MSVYPPQAAVRAREHHAAGWALTDIRRLIGREFGRSPSWHTVKAWVDPVWGRAQTDRYRPAKRQHLQRKKGLKPLRNVSVEWKSGRVRELYARGLSLRAIGQVAAVWWGEELSEAGVREVLGLRRGEVARRIGARPVLAEAEG